MKQKKAVTLREVARVAGVSPRTVSNVANGYQHVAPHTRQHVQAVIDSLGYRVNTAARSLRSGSTGLIGLVVPSVEQPYFAQLASAVISEAGKASRTVVIEQTDGDPTRERALLRQGPTGAMFDGLILNPLRLTAADLQTLDAGGRPLVLLGERAVDPAFDHIHIDNVAAARDATQHLIEIGRKRIAAIGVQDLATGSQRTTGFMEALADAGMPAHPRLLRSVEGYDRANGYAQMRALLDDDQRPDAVFCFSDMLAIGAMRACLSSGVRVPEDIAIIGIDDVEDGQYSTPTLSTIRPDRNEIARQAVQRLLARIDHRGDEPMPALDITVSHRLVQRESTRA